MLCWLHDRKPDVVALQKIKVQERDFPKDEFRAAGYYSEAHCYPKSHLGCADHGVAILTRREPRCVEKGLDGQEHLGARLLTVDVDGLEFSSVYAPWSKTEGIDAKLTWFDSLIDHLGKTRMRSKQRVLCGDFNVVPAERYGPRGPDRNSLNYHREVQARFNVLLKEGGLCDLYVRRPPPDWVDPFRFEACSGCLKFSRLEYVLGTQSIADRDPLVEFDVDHAIVKNRFFHWVRSPILVHLPD